MGNKIHNHFQLCFYVKYYRLCLRKTRNLVSNAVSSLHCTRNDVNLWLTCFLFWLLLLWNKDRIMYLIFLFARLDFIHVNMFLFNFQLSSNFLDVFMIIFQLLLQDTLNVNFDVRKAWWQRRNQAKWNNMRHLANQQMIFTVQIKHFTHSCLN